MSRLQILDIQSSLNSQVQLSMHGNVDENPSYLHSEEISSTIRARGSTAFAEVLKHNLVRVARREALSVDELVDTLTLVDANAADSKPNFYNALKLISLASSTHDRDINVRLVWWRLLLADNWRTLSAMKSDAKARTAIEKTVLYTTLSLAIEDSDTEHPVLLPDSLEILFKPETLSLSIDVIRNRYAYADNSLLKSLHSDLERERDLLNSLLTDCSLGSYVQSTYSAACLAHNAMGEFSAHRARYADK
jgi:hypothetical protein